MSLGLLWVKSFCLSSSLEVAHKRHNFGDQIHFPICFNLQMYQIIQILSNNFHSNVSMQSILAAWCRSLGFCRTQVDQSDGLHKTCNSCQLQILFAEFQFCQLNRYQYFLGLFWSSLFTTFWHHFEVRESQPSLTIEQDHLRMNVALVIKKLSSSSLWCRLKNFTNLTI